MSQYRVSALALAFVLAAAASAYAQPAGGGGGGRFSACQGDVAKLCQGVERGGGRIRECLRAHSDQLSSGCKTAIAQAMAARRQGEAPPPTTP